MTGERVDRLRRFLLGLSFLSLLVTLAELYLENHNQELLQLVPWGLCLLGLAALLPALLRPSRGSIMALRVVMAVLAVGGAIGSLIHLKENFEFEQEVHAGVAFGSALGTALKGAAPLFAPGALVFAALIALAATYYHPALEK